MISGRAAPSASGSIGATRAMPPESARAVSKDSARRSCRSGRTRKRSITTSMSCFFLRSRSGGSSSSNSSAIDACPHEPLGVQLGDQPVVFPLAAETTGASSIRRSPSGRAST